MLSSPAPTRGVTRLDGDPMVEPELFRKQIYCTEESTCDTVVTFRLPPQWFSTQGIVPLASPWLLHHWIPVHCDNSMLQRLTNIQVRDTQIRIIT